MKDKENGFSTTRVIKYKGERKKGERKEKQREEERKGATEKQGNLQKKTRGARHRLGSGRAETSMIARCEGDQINVNKV